MDALPAFATAVSRSVRRIEVFRRQDASIRRIPFQKKIGVGLDAETFAREVAAGRIRHVGLPESLHFLAHVLSIPIQRFEESIDPILAERPLESALGPIPKGNVSGIRHRSISCSRTASTATSQPRRSS
jgi:4-hydroxy-tetrahydrodipicolinate reductase